MRLDTLCNKGFHIKDASIAPQTWKPNSTLACGLYHRPICAAKQTLLEGALDTTPRIFLDGRCAGRTSRRVGEDPGREVGGVISPSPAL